MKIKTIQITVRETVGLPKYSSKSIEVTEEIELEDGDSAKHIRNSRFSVLNNWVEVESAKIKKQRKEEDE